MTGLPGGSPGSGGSVVGGAEMSAADVVASALGEGEAAAEAKIAELTGEGAGDEGGSGDDAQAGGEGGGEGEKPPAAPPSPPPAGAAPKPGEGKPGEGKPKAYYEGRPWKAARVGADGKEATLDTLAELKGDDLLNTRITFTANQKPVSLTVDQLVDRAQQFYGAIKREETLRVERNEAVAYVEETQPMLERAAAFEERLARAFESYATDGGRALSAIKDAYLTALSKRGEAPPAGAGAGAGDPPAERGGGGDGLDRHARGAEVINNHLHPYAIRVAEAYGADPVKVLQGIVDMVAQEPVGFSEERLAEILNDRLPIALEEDGLRASGTHPRFDVESLKPAGTRGGSAPKSRFGKESAMVDAKGADAAAQAEIARLRSELAIAKGESAPPPPGGGAGGAAPRASSGGGRADARTKSSMIDLDDADTLDKVMERVGNVGRG